MSNKTRIAPTMTILEEKFKNDVNPQWITFHMTHILLYSMYYSGLCKSKRDVCAFFGKIAVRSRKVVSQSVCMDVCMYVCCNAARALLTQRTDLKFCENVLNQPVLCRFFQIFDISPNLAVNEKNGFFRWDTFKGWKMTKIDQFFFNLLESCLAWSVLQISKIRELWRHQILV